MLTNLGTCRPSNTSMCRGCQVCLMDTLSQAILPAMDATVAARAVRLNTTCMNLAASISQLVNPSKCAAMLGQVAQTPDLSQRAGALCTAMGACDPALPICNFTIGSALRAGQGPPLSGLLDTCSVEGVPGGAVPAGLVPPMGECHWAARAAWAALSSSCAG
jgi:hypothetical protein